MEKGLSQELLALFLPEGLLTYFDIVSYSTSSSGKYVYDKQLELTLDEKDIIPTEYKSYPYKSSGFMDARYIEDYPIRDMLVRLKVSRNWEVIAQGTRMSAEYAAFLKEISRF